jgi:hypothetical protein
MVIPHTAGKDERGSGLAQWLCEYVSRLDVVETNQKIYTVQSGVVKMPFSDHRSR